MRLRTLLVLPSAAAIGLAFAGCSAPVPPEQALADAFAKTGESSSATVTMKLDTTAEDLTTLIEAASRDTSAPAMQQLDVVTAIVPKLALTTAVKARSGSLNSALTPEAADAAFTVSVDGKPLEVRWVDSQFFLHADVEGIGQATGLFTATQVKMMATQLSAQLPWLTDVINGDWVGLDKDSSAKLIAKAQEQAASAQPSAEPTVDPAKARDALLGASTVTKVDDSTFKVATDAKKLITAFADISDTDDFTTQDADEAIADINDGADLDTTVTVTGGKVTRIVVDIADVLRTWPNAKLASDGSVERLASAEFTLNGVVEIDNTDPKIAAPSPATTIPASDIDTLLKG